VILLAAQMAGLQIFEYPPAEIKKAVVGSGAATKEQVQFMLTRLLRLKAVPQPSDAADGVAAALTYCMGARVAALGAAASRRSTRI
jgi:crossover junction endodeoxyribonuclease RuvC